MKLNSNYTKNILIFCLLIVCGCSNDDHEITIAYPPGGYQFAKEITDKDFYHYPLIGKISRRDSFYIAYDDGYFFRLFKEPNISLRPAAKPIFRLACSGRYDCYVISLTEDKIIVKETKDVYWPEIDLDKLTETERKHWRILRREFPLDEVKPFERVAAPLPPPDQLDESIRRKNERDSIVKNTPELFNPKYYDYLLKKATINRKDSFSFTTKVIKITKEDFGRVVNLINALGYWKIPYELNWGMVNDANSYILEANNGIKYNAVNIIDEFEGRYEFRKACQELKKMAKIDNQIEKFIQ